MTLGCKIHSDGSSGDIRNSYLWWAFRLTHPFPSYMLMTALDWRAALWLLAQTDLFSTNTQILLKRFAGPGQRTQRLLPSCVSFSETKYPSVAILANNRADWHC